MLAVFYYLGYVVMANSKRRCRGRAEKHHLSKVAALGCIAYLKIGHEDTPAEIHHIRSGVGMGQRNDDYHAIPLCPEHHRHGKNAIHQSKVFFERDFGTESELLELVNSMVLNVILVQNWDCHN